ncbi:dihydrodipicolinate synthase family protein [Brevibacterium litoralis]|uniref:dihydrodipicolinate synthase family protein n=1 Tax=Brevibacterium litoralis TaxID=3138935 RepID=UPI0032EAD251
MGPSSPSPFTGLSAFTLTPFVDEAPDLDALARLTSRAATSGVDSIGVLGSTGSYMYLSRDERTRLTRTAIDAAGDTPVVVGVGALSTRQVLDLATDAQDAGAAGLLVAVPTYQALDADEVHSVFERVSAVVDVPVILYDNPGTTHVTYSPELYGSITSLPHVAGVKIPPTRVTPGDVDTSARQLLAVRESVAPGTAVGISGDPAATTALLAGADLWFSVLAGVLPGPCLDLTRAATDLRSAAEAPAASAHHLHSRLSPLWELFHTHGSLRPTAAIAEELGLVRPDSLPAPIRGLPPAARESVARIVEELDLR